MAPLQTDQITVKRGNVLRECFYLMLYLYLVLVPLFC